MVEEFAKLIPDSLLDVSGKAFYSGRDAFGAASDLYILGINPGGDPESYPTETVGAHTRKVLHEVPDNWSAFIDEGWSIPPMPPGQHKMQKNVLHLLKRLDLDCRKIPASNLVFERSETVAKIQGRLDRLTLDCWPFHRAVIQRLGVRVVVCGGMDAAEKAMPRLEDDNPTSGKFTLRDTFMAKYGLKATSKVYRNGGGVTLVQLPHPSRFIWTHPKSDPTELVRQALESGS